MPHRIRAAIAFCLVGGMLAACSPNLESNPGSTLTPTSTATTTAQASAADSISNIDDGLAWAQGLSDDADAGELSEGLQRLGDLVPDLDLDTEIKNEIGQELVSLNADVLADPDGAGEYVPEIQSLAARLGSELDPQ